MSNRSYQPDFRRPYLEALLHLQRVLEDPAQHSAAAQRFLRLQKEASEGIGSECFLWSWNAQHGNCEHAQRIVPHGRHLLHWTAHAVCVVSGIVVNLGADNEDRSPTGIALRALADESIEGLWVDATLRNRLMVHSAPVDGDGKLRYFPLTLTAPGETWSFEVRNLSEGEALLRNFFVVGAWIETGGNL